MARVVCWTEGASDKQNLWECKLETNYGPELFDGQQ